MTDHPTLFDAAAIQHSARRRTADASFLFDEIGARLLDQITDINREFAQVAIIGFAPQLIKDHFPKLDCIPFYEEQPPTELTADSLPGALDFPNPPYDLIISVTGLHRVNDPIGALIQANRALKPDGLLIAALFAGDTLFELRRSLLLAETELTGRAAQRVLPFGDIRDLGALLQRAGLALPVADLDQIPVSYRSFDRLLNDLRHMGESNVLSSRVKRFAPKALFKRAGDLYARDFSTEEGHLKASFDIAFLSGWHPHESQQQPLAPGSGKVSMAEVLERGPKSADRFSEKPSVKKS